jgi:flagellar L-ring protein FlgH
MTGAPARSLADVRRGWKALWLWAVVASATACGPRHVQPFTPRQRVYTPGDYAQKDASAKPTIGSLFSDANPGYLEDTRAVRVGDFVVININENANAQGDSNTNLSRDNSASASVDAMLGVVPALKRAYPDIDPSQLISFASKAGFVGSGKTERAGQLTGSIAVRVVKEMPNTDLFIEGTKVVLINNEEYHLYLSGLVRRADIAQDNSIASTRIADAQIEFTGRGDLADQNRKGWFARLLDTFNPL